MQAYFLFCHFRTNFIFFFIVFKYTHRNNLRPIFYQETSIFFFQTPLRYRIPPTPAAHHQVSGDTHQSP